MKDPPPPRTWSTVVSQPYDFDLFNSHACAKYTVQVISSS